MCPVYACDDRHIGEKAEKLQDSSTPKGQVSHLCPVCPVCPRLPPLTGNDLVFFPCVILFLIFINTIIFFLAYILSKRRLQQEMSPAGKLGNVQTKVEQASSNPFQVPPRIGGVPAFNRSKFAYSLITSQNCENNRLFSF